MDNANETLAEAFSKTGGGSSAFLGAARPSFTIPNHQYDKELYKAIYISHTYTLGDVSNIAASKIIDWYGAEGQSNAKIYLWLADPAMEAYTDGLSTFNPANVTITDNGSSVTVNTGSVNCDICVSSVNNGESYFAVAYGQTNYTFSTSIRPLHISLRKHN